MTSRTESENKDMPRPKRRRRRKKGLQSAKSSQSADSLAPNTSLDGESNGNAPLPLTRADKLKDKQLEEIAEKASIVAFMQQGMTAQEALKFVPMQRPRSVSWAQKLYQNYNKIGTRAFIDGRWERTTDANVMIDEVRKLVIFFYLDLPAAGPRAIWKEVSAECERRGLPKPSYSLLKLHLASIPIEIKHLRNGDRGLRQWDKDERPVIRFENAFYANERWQIDDCHLPVWARHKVNGEWKPCKVYLTDSIDNCTRAIPGFVLSHRVPDAWSVKLLLRQAILPKQNEQWTNKGMPTVIEFDNGKNFKSKEMGAAAGFLKIWLEFGPPYYPNLRGKIERFHRTLNEGCLKRLPSHMDAIGTTYEAAKKQLEKLPTVGQLRKFIERWIVEDYHQRVHSATGRKPAEHWEETVRLRMPESDDAINLLLHHHGPCSLSNTGIRFTYERMAHTYWCPDLFHFLGRKFLLRFNPDDMESVYVYLADTGEFVGEAWDMESDTPRYSIDDIKQAGEQILTTMAERMKKYYDEVEREDRPRKAQEMMREIREEQAAREAGADGADATPQEEEFDPELLDKFKAFLRGEGEPESDDGRR